MALASAKPAELRPHVRRAQKALKRRPACIASPLSIPEYSLAHRCGRDKYFPLPDETCGRPSSVFFRSSLFGDCRTLRHPNHWSKRRLPFDHCGHCRCASSVHGRSARSRITASLASVRSSDPAPVLLPCCGCLICVHQEFSATSALRVATAAIHRRFENVFPHLTLRLLVWERPSIEAVYPKLEKYRSPVPQANRFPVR